MQTKDHKGDPRTVRMTPEEKALHEHATAMPPSICDWVDPDTGKPAELDMTSELFIEGLVNDALLLKDVAKMTRGKVAFVRDGKLYTVKCEPTAANVAKVKERNPGAVMLNGMDDLTLLATVRAVKCASVCKNNGKKSSDGAPEPRRRRIMEPIDACNALS